MSKTSENKLTMHYRGKFGQDFFFRMCGNKSVMCKLHDYSNMVWSGRQQDNRKYFRRAARWAQSVLVDEKVKRYYKKKAKRGQSAYNMAIADYMKTVRLEADFRFYDCLKGGKMKFSMKHVFGASSAEVIISGPGGIVIERGPAKMTDKGFGFEYNANPEVDVKLRYVQITLHRGPVALTRTFDFLKEFQ